ncbi:MFS transporter [Corynebacterium sp. zg-331]|uniref:peptide MFS transporter n=1 Tax=unclassified Corynebacterium TaxID=2624378 RepID=UPI00128C3DF2|nr:MULTISPECIES: oligopeptide:H+ symporter [unclassified Corynebacterium]MBC3186452.1 MFS transporter [Corynebacterium sp. zg-331]MPV52937.1 MFS transporter [Corynebacterium sp. zg331]
MNTSEGRTFLGQPWGLANLFGIELWERFSYYGMVTILGYYLYYAATDGGLGMDEGTALSLVGAYGGFVYITAVAASFLSDRLLGPERTLFLSAILVMAGHIALALIPGFPGLGLGVALIGLGSGGVKTASQVVLGDLYSRTDPQRDAGFSLFYMAVNIGALLGPLATGEAWKHGGFHWGFGLAAIGMCIGLAQYVLMRKGTINPASRTVPNPLPRGQYLPWALGSLILLALLASPFVFGLLPLKNLAHYMAGLAFLAAVVLLAQMFRSPHTTAQERSRLVGYLPLLFGCVMFFAIFQSQFTILALYTDTRVNLDVFGYHLQPSQVQSVNPLFIIAFSGLFATLWSRLGERQWSSPVKFGVSNLIIGASLFLFLPYAGGGANSTPLLIIVALLFLFTMGELLLSPVGNSLATKVAPAAFKSRMFAVWLMSLSMGTSLAGVLGTRYEAAIDAGPSAERAFFIAASAATIGLGVALILLRGWVVRKFGDVR